MITDVKLNRKKVNEKLLVNSIAKDTGISNKVVKEVIKSLKHHIKRLVRYNVTVCLTGFCTFSLKEYKSKKAYSFKEKANIELGGNRYRPGAEFSDIFVAEVKKKNENNKPC
ncbi:MAG: HU family DNA-binding protein [Anaerovoracaceae bacterium]